MTKICIWPWEWPTRLISNNQGAWNLHILKRGFT